MKDIESLGGRLKEVLLMRGIAASELSKKLNIEAGYLSKLLNNKIKKPHRNIQRITEFLDVSHEWIMTGKETSHSYERSFDIEFFSNNEWTINGKFETSLAISKTERVIYHDNTLNIVSKRQLGAGMYLFERNGEIIELYREDAFLTMNWHPAKPMETDTPIGKVMTKITREHINDKKIEFVKD